ncbi:hypothetical protein K3495_g10296 [Podosphaera aphanis]|nr:hypothetical protein K3495_g10296 [Podosphaera aphanis]
MPRVNANSAGLSGYEPGPRYRDIENSNWRHRSQYHNGSNLERDRVGQRELSCNEYYDAEMTFERFTGESFVETSRNNTQSMSVVLECKSEEKAKEFYEIQKKSVRFDELTEDKVALESFLNEGDLTKRARPMNIEDILNKEEQALKIRKKSHKRRQRVL